MKPLIKRIYLGDIHPHPRGAVLVPSPPRTFHDIPYPQSSRELSLSMLEDRTIEQHISRLSKSDYTKSHPGKPNFAEPAILYVETLGVSDDAVAIARLLSALKQLNEFRGFYLCP